MAFIDDDSDISRAVELKIPARRFSFVRLGHSFRCTELEAALGVAQLEELTARTARPGCLPGERSRGLFTAKG